MDFNENLLQIMHLNRSMDFIDDANYQSNLNCYAQFIYDLCMCSHRIIH